MLASSKSLHDAAIFPHFFEFKDPKIWNGLWFCKGTSGDWNRIYFISWQMGISRAWKNIKGLSSSYNENYYCSAKSTRTLAHMCNTMNSRWWKWWRESHHCCLHFWSVELLQQLLPTGICDFSAYNCASDAKIGVLRNFCHKGSWSHLSLVLQASFNIFFTAEEMSILSHAAQHWPKVINWRFYKKFCSKCTWVHCSRCKTMTSHQKVHISGG